MGTLRVKDHRGQAEEILAGACRLPSLQPGSRSISPAGLAPELRPAAKDGQALPSPFQGLGPYG